MHPVSTQTEKVVQIQQARYKHARTMENLNTFIHKNFEPDLLFDQTVKFQVDSFGLRAEGIDQVVTAQSDFMKSIGPHKSTINRFSVDFNERGIFSTDETFVYSTLTGTCVAIFTNLIEWKKIGDNWVIKSQVVNQDWCLPTHSTH